MFVTNFLYTQLFVTPPYPTTSFAGRTVIVTGSNVGLGLEAARHIARLGCEKLILAVRTVSKGETAKQSIVESTKCKSDSIEVWELDMAKSASVKAFVTRVNGLDRLDAIVENAGVMQHAFYLDEGVEQTIKVNVISTFLLALLLLPKLRETNKKHDTTTHLAIVSSGAHNMTSLKQFDFPDIYAVLNDKKHFQARTRYNISKALEVMFVKELVKHARDGPIITLINPGLCHSEFFRNSSGTDALLERSLKVWMARTSEVGSRTLVKGACADRSSHGEYMSDCADQEITAWMRRPKGQELRERVYNQTLAVLESIEPGISNNI